MIEVRMLLLTVTNLVGKLVENSKYILTSP